jgi:hypothetical protein
MSEAFQTGRAFKNVMVKHGCKEDDVSIDHIVETFHNATDKDGLVSDLTDINHRRITEKEMHETIHHWLSDPSDENIKIMQDFFDGVKTHLAALKERQSFHMCLVGLPGGGKSTNIAVIAQKVLHGKFGAGKNEALARLLDDQSMNTGNPNYIHIELTKGMSGFHLRAILREALQHINPREVLIIHLDEIDRLALMDKKSKPEFLVALQDLAEFSLVHKEWFTKNNANTFERPPAIVFLWTGNMFARAGCSSPSQERISIYDQLQSALNGKFTAGTRMPSAATTVIIRYVPLLQRL